MAQPSRSPSFAQENLSDRRTVGRAAARVRKCEDGADSHEGVVAPYAPSTSRTAAFSGRTGCRRRPVDSDDLRSERTAIRCHRRWRPRIIRKRSSGTTYGPTRGKLSSWASASCSARSAVQAASPATTGDSQNPLALTPHCARFVNELSGRAVSERPVFPVSGPRAKTLRTLIAYQRPPRGVGTPRAFSAAAISRSVVAPDALNFAR